LAVILERQIASQFAPAAGAISSGVQPTNAERLQFAGPVATAFGHTFWWAVAITLIAFIPSLFLSRRPAQAQLPPPPPQKLDGLKENEEENQGGKAPSDDLGGASGSAVIAGARRHRQPRHTRTKPVTPPVEG
jgi:hypothetical protein